MTEVKPLVCQNCGGRIDRSTMKCPYCDTQYERKYEGLPVNFVVEKPGVHRIAAMVRIPDKVSLRDPERATQYAMERLRQGIADGLLAYMKIRTELDPMSFCQIIRGEVRVVEPTFTDY